MSQRTESDKPALPPDPPRQLPLPEPPEPVLIVRWRCLNCGQQTFTMPDEAPPDICAYCRDMTTWHRVKP